MRHRQISIGSSRVVRRPFLRLIAAAALGGSLAGCSFTSPDAATGSQSVGIQGVTAQQARSIAREAYLYGTPMVASYQAIYAASIDKNGPHYKGPFNTVHPAGGTGPAANPDPDAQYLFAALDLRAEPVVVTVPSAEKRRDVALQVMDLYTYRVADIGSRTTGNGGGSFLVAGPSWKGKTPAGVTRVVKSETDLATLVARIQRFNAADQKNVERIQSRYKVQPLSAFSKRAAPAAPAAPQWIAPATRAERYTTLEFYEELAFLLQFAPTPSTEKWLRERFASIGIRPGEPYDTEALNPALRRALQEGMHDAQNDIDKNRAALGGKTDTLYGDRSTLKNDYLSRATGVQAGVVVIGGRQAPPAAPKTPVAPKK
ncbi:DUF1254 domain-containing protein [Achromobacter spanius]|uniref:DUF1254 domain-containing protein n=1 Tax=Achromobacter spanius TaxID=217203 RepID=UPI003209FAC9